MGTVPMRSALVRFEPRILIAHAARNQAELELAQAIGAELESRLYTGARVDVVHVDPELEVDPFDVVILGAPLEHGTFSQEARRFATKQRFTLVKKMVGLYLTVLPPVSTASELTAHRAIEQRRVHGFVVERAPIRITPDHLLGAAMFGETEPRRALSWARGIAARFLPNRPAAIEHVEACRSWAKALAPRIELG